MVKYTCKLCDYTSGIKTHYTRHLQSVKHKKAHLIYEKEIEEQRNIYLKRTSDELECEYCYKLYSNDRCLRQHLDRCKVKEEQERKQERENERIDTIKILKDAIENKDEIIRVKNEIIAKKHKIIKKLQDKLNIVENNTN